jgi:hypothetical protein
MSLRTIVEFEDIMQPIIVDLLDWSLTPNNVRVGWQTGSAPAFKITDNVVFITATPVDHLYNRQHDELIEEGSPDLIISRGFTRVMALNIIAYGSEAVTNLQKIQLGMFYNNVRNLLHAEEIYYIPDTPEVRRVPEEFQNQWWERADIQLRFNELLTDEQTVYGVDSVGVTVSDKDGVEMDLNINR